MPHRRKVYESNPSSYRNFYLSQVGSGNAFQGAAIQRGYGLGGILGGLFRAATPLLKQGAKVVGRRVLRTGLDIAGDALSGRNIKHSAKRRLTQAGKELISGRAGRKPASRTIKRKADRRRVISARAKRQRRSPDIFD